MSKTRPYGSNRCPNCGEYGPHFVPPSLGEPGMFICKKKERPMTKEEINRQVAEKVMGLRLTTFPYLQNRFPGWWWCDSKGPIVAEKDWNPAERWDHSGMVVEKLEYDFQIERLGRQWTVHIRDDGMVTSSGQRDTAPMAICLAALEAVKGEEEL